MFERNGFICGYEVTLTYSSKLDRVYNLSGSILGVLIDCKNKCRLLVLTNNIFVCLFVLGLPGFAEVNVSIAAKTIVGVGPSSVPIRIWTNEDGNNSCSLLFWNLSINKYFLNAQHHYIS